MSTTWLRHITAPDVSAVYALEKTLFLRNKGTLDDLLAFFGSTHTGGLCVEYDDGERNQFIGYCIYQHFSKSAFVQIGQFGIHPAYRRQGLGRVLLREVISRTGARDYRCVV